MTLSPAPLTNPAVEKGGFLTLAWRLWITPLVHCVNTAAKRVGLASLTTQSATIAATDVPSQTLSAGLYRVSYYTRVTRAAGTSSELTVTVRWTDGGVTCNTAGAVLNGNTTSTQQSGSVLVRIDNATTIKYLVTYNSVGAPTMQFSLDVTIETVAVS